MAWLENLLLQGTIERLGWMLVHFLWQATVVALLLAAFQRLLRRGSANVRYLTACAALAMMVVLPVATMQLIEVPGPGAEVGPEPPLPATAAPLVPATVVQMPDAVFTHSDVRLETADVTVPILWNERIALVLRPALPYTVLAWLVGVFGLSAWHLGGWMQLQRLKRRTVRGVGAALQRQLAQIADKLGVHAAVTLLESAIAEVPTVVGWLRPVILLPASALTGLSPDQLEAILAHELAHIRRYDYLVNVVQTVVEILGFYHPAVWWVSRRIRIERENCCDDMAVRLCGDSVRYARALTCLEEIRHTQADLAMAATGGSLIDRIARLLGRPASDDRRFAWLPGLITLLFVAGVVIPTAVALGTAGLPQGDASSIDEMTPAPDVEASPGSRQVLLEFLVAQVASDEKLDRDAAIRARALLADAATESDSGVPPVEELQQPLARIIDKYAPRLNVGDNAAEAFTDLLTSEGHARILTKPRILTLEGQRARIVVGEDPNRDPSDASDEADAGGLSMEVTPTLQDDPNAILLSLGFNIRNAVIMNDFDGKVRVRGKAAVNLQTSDAFRNGQRKMFPLHVALDSESVSVDVPTETLLLLIKATIVDEPMAVSVSEPNDPAGTSVRVSYTLVEVAAGRTLDPQTAAEARTLLVHRPAGNPSRVMGPLPQPSIEELQQPLRDVLSASIPARNRDKEFVDLLVSRGYADVVSKPGLLLANGKSGTVEIGEAQDSNTQGPLEDQPFSFLRLEATPHVPEDSNTVLLKTTLVLTHRTGSPDDPNRPSSTTEARTIISMESGRHATLFVGNTARQTQEDANKRLHILLVQPTINRPELTPSEGTDESPVSESNAAETDKAYVQVGVKIVKAVDSSELDRETVLKIEKILGKRVRPEGPAGEFGRRFHLTLGEVLRNHVVGQMLPRETVDTLLPLFRDVEVLSSPKVVAREGEKCQVKIVTDEYTYTVPPASGSSEPGKQEKIEAGTTMEVTARIGDHDAITMEIVVEMTDFLRPSSDRALPVVTRRITQACVTTLNDRYITLGGMSEAGTPAPGEYAESVYIMAIPTIVNGPVGGNDTNEIALGTGGMGGFREPSGQGDTRVFADPAANEQQMQLRMRYVTSDPMYRELAKQVAELEVELIRDGQKYLPEHPEMVQKRALLDAFKSRLDERKKTLEQEFDEQITKQSKAPTNGYAQGDLKTADAPELPVTATFTNADLREVLAEIARRADVSIVADETVKSRPVTVDLADASVEKSLLRVLNGTPYRFQKAGEATNARREQPRITNLFQGDELRQVLQDLATIAGVTILADDTVVGSVYADIRDVPLETALQIVLAGTPYGIRKTPDYYFIADMSLPGAKERRTFEERRNASAWPQGTYLVYRPLRMAFLGESRRRVLMDLADALEVSIAIDGSVTGVVYAELHNVPLETAFRILTAGTPYVVEKKADHYEVTTPRKPTGAEESGTKPEAMSAGRKTITAQFTGEDLRQALRNLADMAEFPVIPDEGVTAPVWADLKDVPLSRALEIVLAGTPYVARKTPHYYLVADRSQIRDLDKVETRRIQMKSEPPAEPGV